MKTTCVKFSVLWSSALLALVFLGFVFGFSQAHSETKNNGARTSNMAPAAPAKQTAEQALAKSMGCESCHQYSPGANDHRTMHANPGVVLGCTDCHGGNASVRNTEQSKQGTQPYADIVKQAHVLPDSQVQWNGPSSANPKGSYTRLNRLSPEFIRFMNPGDMRVAREACGACHLPIIQASERSLMSTSAMLWGGAAYNNGILPYKRYILGEAYTSDSAPAMLKNPTPVSAQMREMGILESLAPLPAWETVAARRRVSCV